MDAVLHEISAALAKGGVVPYLGPELLEQGGENPVPASFEALAARLSARVTVPFKIRTNMTAAAQYIENFKHRKTLVAVMREIFQPPVAPSALHRYFASLPNLPLLVDTWYDAAAQAALAGRPSWGQIQGVSRAEYRDQWVKYYRADGTETSEAQAAGWDTVLYKPFGSIAPAANFIVSDSDFVEVLTEIDIQTPIPPRVQALRSGRSFLFIGCHFRNQLERAYARQIMKRSCDGPHWAVLSGELTRNEIKFLEEQNIQRLDIRSAEFFAALCGLPVAA
ncbi:SIR2 family protein [Sulfuricella sp.]|uniref:SIR2 family NAD-dependent protein deacylase n=1 Tax=Sulfuricella sp. TaxID=2099377 RepID=UPI002C0658FD|nr:SIR2 family protein [Sulfuricella sp.]HUX64888.1 SIR2 family protein [Sulfuricella sp.]